MESLFSSLFLGFIQGITEFLPVSSSGHLFLLQSLFDQEPSISFMVFLHGASLLAVCIYFWRDIFSIVQKMCSIKEIKKDSFGWKLVFSTICTVPVALFLEPFFDSLFSIQLVAWTLLCTAGFVFFSSFYNHKTSPLSELGWSHAFYLGIVQGLAVFPGISRSGITIAFLLLLGMRKEASARISFLLAIPTILGALIFSWSDIRLEMNIWIGLSFLISAISSWLIIWGMMKTLHRYWIWSGIYCLFLGFFLLFFIA